MRKQRARCDLIPKSACRSGSSCPRSPKGERQGRHTSDPNPIGFVRIVTLRLEANPRSKQFFRWEVCMAPNVQPGPAASSSTPPNAWTVVTIPSNLPSSCPGAGHPARGSCRTRPGTANYRNPGPWESSLQQRIYHRRIRARGRRETRTEATFGGEATDSFDRKLWIRTEGTGRRRDGRRGSKRWRSSDCHYRG